jgi:hypothetical protein
MQHDHFVKIGAIVTNALRTRSHRDGSHGVRDGPKSSIVQLWFIAVRRASAGLS